MAVSILSMKTWGEFLTIIDSDHLGKWFDSIEQSGSTLVFTGLKGQKIMEIDMDTYSNEAYPSSVRLYKPSGSYVGFTPGGGASYSKNSKLKHVAFCGNGAIIRFGQQTQANNSGNDYTCELLITKNNNDATAIVISTAGSSASRKSALSGFYCYAEGDDEMDTAKTEVTVKYRTQSQLVEFVSEAGTYPELQTSYTPNAYYVQSGLFFDVIIFTLVLEGHTYISNGYWAIKD